MPSQLGLAVGPVDDELGRDVDLVITSCVEARPRTLRKTWNTDEASERDIDRFARMQLRGNDIVHPATVRGAPRDLPCTPTMHEVGL